MKHAYLIMAHDNFEQLKLLIKALDHPRTDLFIHIDPKANFSDFEDLKLNATHSYVDVFSSVSVFWSDYSLTECELVLLEKAKSHDVYEFYHLISNADFPTMSQEKILHFFDANIGREFISISFPRNAWPFSSKPYTTETKYYHVLSKYYRTKNKLLNFIVYCIEYFFVSIQFLLRIDRIHGQYFPPKGSEWWSITDEFASYILSKRDWIKRNFKMTRASDEVFACVLAYNSKFRNNLYSWDYHSKCHSNQRLIDWHRGFPYSYKLEDYGEIISTGLPFVRKVDMRNDGGLVLKLYEKIMKESGNLK